MAVALEFINVIVRIDAIQKKFPGGWPALLHDLDFRIGAVGWFDDHLYREGAMNPRDAQWLVEQWAGFGLEVYKEKDGNPVEWVDICIAESMFGPSLKCEWLSFTEDGNAVYLKGTDPGEVVARDHFSGFSWADWSKTQE